MARVPNFGPKTALLQDQMRLENEGTSSFLLQKRREGRGSSDLRFLNDLKLRRGMAHVTSTMVSTISVSRRPSPKKAPAEPVLKLARDLETTKLLTHACASIPKYIHVCRKPHKEHLV
jgi:hypothetical protein